MLNIAEKKQVVALQAKATNLQTYVVDFNIMMDQLTRDAMPEDDFGWESLHTPSEIASAFQEYAEDRVAEIELFDAYRLRSHALQPA